MRYSVLACLLLVILGLSNAQSPYLATPYATLDADHNATISINCSVISTSAFAAVYFGNNHKNVTSALIQTFVNKNTPSYTNGSWFYGFQEIDAGSKTFSFAQINSTSLQNLGENYTIIGYCNNSTDSIPAYGTWTQPDNNGTNYYIDVTYNTTIGNISDVQKAQAKAISTEFTQLLPSQVVDGGLASTTVVRTYVLRNVETHNDTTWTLYTPSLNTTIQTYLNTQSLAGPNITITSVDIESVPHPSVGITSLNSTNSSVSISIVSTVTGTGAIVGVAASNFDPKYLSNDNVLALTDDQGKSSFTFAQNVNLTKGTAAQFVVPNLVSNTIYNFYAVVQSASPANELSNITAFTLSTTANIPNTTNATYTASVNVAFNNALHSGVITVSCSQPSVVAAYWARVGNHPVTSTPAAILNCANDKDIDAFTVSANRSDLCGKSVDATNNFTFTITADNLRNLGENYSVTAVCKNSTAGLSSSGSGKWLVPDNNGNNFQLGVVYNGTLNVSLYALNQTNALANLFNIPASLLQTVQVNSSGYARSLDGNATNTTTIQTYVLRNYTLADDSNTVVAVTNFSKNVTDSISKLEAFYTANNLSNLTVLNLTVSEINNPAATFSFISKTSSQVVVEVGSNVYGPFSVCAVPASAYNQTDSLDGSDVAYCHDENANAWGLHKFGYLMTAAKQNVTIDGLSASTTYNIFAVVQDSLPTPTTSNIVELTVTTSASSSGSFGERYGFGLALIITLIAVLFN